MAYGFNEDKTLYELPDIVYVSAHLAQVTIAGGAEVAMEGDATAKAKITDLTRAGYSQIATGRIATGTSGLVLESVEISNYAQATTEWNVWVKFKNTTTTSKSPNHAYVGLVFAKGHRVL